MYRATAAAGANSFRAVTSTGVIVQIESGIFMDILARIEHPLIVMSHKKWAFGSEYQYLTQYKGLYFYTESKDSLPLPEEIELIVADQMWIPKF